MSKITDLERKDGFVVLGDPAVERFRQRAAAGKKLQEDRAQKHTHDDIDVM